MDKGKKCNEGEMGSGDSDDEFYNVKLPCTPAQVTQNKPVEKLEVEKVYSPSRTAVKYDYKFDSSSDDDCENGNQKDWIKATSTATKTKCNSQNSDSEKSMERQEEFAKEKSNLSQSTYKVVEKINEELKNMKNVGGIGENKCLPSQHLTASSQTSGSVQKSQIGVVPPVVVVPPPMVVSQSPVMNMTPMLVPASVRMGGQNIVHGHMMGMGNMLRGPTPMGGLVAGQSSGLSSGMMGMNVMQTHMAGMMGMQGNIIGLSANAMSGQGSIMGLQTGMINPALSGMNMPIQGNMIGINASGNNMLRLQRPHGGVMNMQGSSNMMGIPRPSGNMLGMPRSMNISGTAGTMLGMQNSGPMTVSPTNPMVVMGNVMGNVTNSNAVGTQANIMNNPGNVVVNHNVVAVVGASQANPPVRSMPPTSFLNLRNRAPSQGGFKWQTSGTIRSPTAAGTGTCLTVPSPASSPTDRGNNNQCDGGEVPADDKDRSSMLKTDESQSPRPPPLPPREVPNTFKNDGSFMEMFKRMKDEKSREVSNKGKPTDSNEAGTSRKPSVILSGIVGKRRGGRVLKTGLVKKVKKESDTEEEKHPKDAWSMYMAEVKKYREASCEEEGKTRPLVK